MDKWSERKFGGKMKEKVTWDFIFMDFKRRHPNLAKMATYYHPFGFLTILVFFYDGSKMAYDFSVSSGRFIA